MDLFFALLAGLLFSMACNLDTVLLAVGYAAKGIHISFGGSVIIAAITTVITWLSLALGSVAAGVLDSRLSEMLGGLVLAGIGAWFLLDYLRHMGAAEEGAPPPTAGAWAWVSLAAALAVNNAGVGVAAGVSGLSPLLASGCNFVVTLAFLPLGRLLGRGLLGRLLGKYALPLSGVLLIILGLWELLL